MSAQIDWSKAPADATHANGAGVFFRENKRGPLAAFDNGSWVITRSTIADFNPEYIFERPTTPSWSGEGLPPVGVVCEWEHEANKGKWHKAAINYIGSAYVIVSDFAGIEQHYYLRSMKFRPIRPPEQIAADEREAAIKEACAVVGCSVGSWYGEVVAKVVDHMHSKQPTKQDGE